jgi:hypoxanthine phosphoribosyltransferase
MRYVTIPIDTDFIQVSSYAGTESTNEIVLKKDVPIENIAGKHVIVVEDLIDTGATLFWLVEHLRSKGPKSIKLLALLDKPFHRKEEYRTLLVTMLASLP